MVNFAEKFPTAYKEKSRRLMRALGKEATTEGEIWVECR